MAAGGGGRRGRGMGPGRGFGGGGRQGMRCPAGSGTGRYSRFGLTRAGAPFAYPAEAIRRIPIAGTPGEAAKGSKAAVAKPEAAGGRPAAPKRGAQLQRIAVVDEEMCSGCGICVEFCPEHAFVFRNTKVRINPHKCTGCGACLDQCPNGAISMLEFKRAVVV